MTQTVEENYQRFLSVLALQAAAENKPVFAPTAEQKEIITHPASPLLVVAGAGSGKTATMTQRILYSVISGQCRPEEILCLTFTRKATAEIGERVSAVLRHTGEPPGPGVAAETYNAFSQGLLREFGLLAGVDPNAALLDETTKGMVLESLLDHSDDEEFTDVAFSTLRDGLLSLVTNLTNYFLDEQEVDRILEREIAAAAEIATFIKPPGKYSSLMKKPHERVAVTRKLLNVVAKYRQYKQSHGYIDFSDQDGAGAQLAQIEVVREAIRQRYKLVILDEFQDTSEAQMRMLSGLFCGHNVTAVGDPLQAIYEWRGASASALSAFRTRFAEKENPAPILTLSTSWRNTQPILDVANKLIASWLDPQTPPELIPGRIRPVRLQVPEAKADKPAQPVTMSLVETAEDVETEVVAQILKHRRPDQTAAILVRTSKDIRRFVEVLNEAGIDAVATGLSGLLMQPEVADVVAALRVVADPSDGEAMMRLMQNIDIGFPDLARMQKVIRERNREGGNANLRDLLSLLPDATESEIGGGISVDAQGRLEQLRNKLVLIEQSSNRDLVELVRTIVRVFDIDLDLELSSRSRQARASLTLFLDYVRGFSEANTGADLQQLLDWIERARQDDDGLRMPEYDGQLKGIVQILTMHSAKGLEWDLVVVPSFHPRQFPDVRKAFPWYTQYGEIPDYLKAGRETDFQNSLWKMDQPLQSDDPKEYRTRSERVLIRVEQGREIEKKNALQAERRLAYVAITRAREKLVLIGTGVVMEPPLLGSISQFLSELLDLADSTIEISPEWIGQPIELDDTSIFEIELEQEQTEETELEEAKVDTGLVCKNCVQPLQVDPASLPEIEASLPLPTSHARQQLALAKAQIEKQMRSDSLGLWPENAPDSLAALAAMNERVGEVQTGESAAQLAHYLVELSAAAQMLLQEKQDESRDLDLALPQSMAVTAVERLLADPQQYLLEQRRPMPQPNAGGAQFGDYFHRVMQHLLLSGRAPQLVDIHSPEEGNVIAVPARFHKTLQAAAANVAKLDLFAKYEVVMVEETIVSPGAPRLVAKLDALLKAEDGSYLIVDWKTGGAKEIYRHQVLLYRAVLAEQYKLPLSQIRAVLIYATGASAQLDWVSDQDLEGSKDVTYWRQQISAATKETSVMLSDVGADQDS